jgi:dGTPase
MSKFELKKDKLLNSGRRNLNAKHHSNNGKESNYKNSFFSDIERITFCSSFRRLQDKTQVYPLEIRDFARNRLTHSIEVASIASSMANIIYKNIYNSLRKSDVISGVSNDAYTKRQLNRDMCLCL